MLQNATYTEEANMIGDKFANTRLPLSPLSLSFGERIGFLGIWRNSSLKYFMAYSRNFVFIIITVYIVNHFIKIISIKKINLN